MPGFSNLVDETRATFKTGRTRSLEWRKTQLRALIKMLENHEKEFCEVLYQDLHKHKNEAMGFEVNLSRNDAVVALDNLEEWTQPEKVKSNMMTMMDTCFIQREPYGVALIIGAWNYPVQLTLLPLIGAIAAGNCAIIKPSEMTEATAVLLERLVHQYLDPQCIRVVNGGVKETTELLEEQFDYIFYTGNSMVGKIVMAAAAKYLTGVTLELGGKSPVYVDKDSDLSITAHRIMWGKCANSGQTCIAPDYVMCEPSIKDKLLASFKTAVKDFYGNDPSKSDSYARIINNRHFNRVKGLTQGAKVAIGGDMIEADKYIGPTVLDDVKPSDSVMQQEVFGPVLPVMTVSGPDEAIDFINSREKPLAMYIFSNNSRTPEKFLKQTSSGGFLVNDTMLHAGHDYLPFGGVGNSGMGAYHGKFSFDTFSHKRACMLKKQGMEKVNGIRYPPYTQKKLDWLTWIMKKSPKKGRGIMSLFPFVIVAAIIAFLFKSFGMQEYLPKQLKNE